MLTIDLESGFPIFLQANGRILEEGLGQGLTANPLCLESGSTLLLQDGSAILEEGSIIAIFLDLESGSSLLTESLLKFVA